ncbi:hypothetical protein [Hymenobacter guriensis]|uniref:DUF3828 domain-containing protein n=1 Tax=Hymenobacter guriensis TaxID=2793065 RepID=A0ABS0L765_9BACT|nr:hypothetical protein [Hymenobacter guriensis]MBG8555942.1 hypothetical protein [Hymenobacter guriensis]
MPSCGTNQQPATQAPAAPADSIVASPAPALPQAPAPADQAAEQTVRRFIGWYAATMEKLPGDFILNADGQDTTKFYAVNFPGTEQWLTALKASGFFADSYLQKWRTYFRQQNDSLRAHPQNDGPPPGFDFDFLTYSQEADTKLTELRAGTFATTFHDKNHALVKARGPHHNQGDENWQEALDVSLVRAANNRWLIEAISNTSF